MGSLSRAESVRAARRRFFGEGRLPDGLMPAPVLRSWIRCSERGLSNDRRPRPEPLTAAELGAARERHERLSRHCRPELETLHGEARATDSIVILTAPDGLILETVGSADFAHRAARVALRPGAPWDEAATGTNAIGTALVERQPVEIRGGEHFFEPHGFLSCAAVPIFDPQGGLAGVLDLSGPAATAPSHALGLVRFAVDEIEHRFFRDAFPGARVVRFHVDHGFLATPREGVLVFDDARLVAANRHGLRLLGLDWGDVGARRLAELFDGGLDRAGEGGGLVGRDGRRYVATLDRPAARPMAVARPGPPAALAPYFAPATRAALERAVKLVDADVPVTIEGETGSGKEVFAREVHRLSRRAGRPFVAVNCAALPESLIESELFGYEEGAFTGARRKGHAGLVRAADGGVLFLDEIGDMPLASQTRLLRVLEERAVTPLGAARPVPVDFALVCASHRDLGERIAAGQFRQDLYFRIAQYGVSLPPLRAVADRAALVADCWRRLAPHGPPLAAETLARLAAYDWPGNFRQLAGTLRALRALSEPGEAVGPDLLPPRIAGRTLSQPADGAPPEEPPPADLEAMTRRAMLAAVEAADGNISRAARRLGVHRSTLYRNLAVRGRAADA